LSILNQITLDATKEPLSEVLFTCIGLFLVALFSWAAKRWFCHNDRDRFMKRKKRIIDELCGIAGGLLVFCAVAAVQFGVRTRFVIAWPTSSEITVNLSRVSLAVQLAGLTIGSAALLIATTAFRTVLGKIDKKLILLEQREICIPPEVDYPFPTFIKSGLLAMLSVCTICLGWLLVNVFANHLDLLHN